MFNGIVAFLQGSQPSRDRFATAGMLARLYFWVDEGGMLVPKAEGPLFGCWHCAIATLMASSGTSV
jgi:hypothetical protein